MLDDNLVSKLNIKVQKIDDIFQATSSLFPEAIGVGGSSKEAVEDLADLLAFKIESLVKGSVSLSGAEVTAATDSLDIESNLGELQDIDLDKIEKIAKSLLENSSDLTKSGKKSFSKTDDKGSFTFDMPLDSMVLGNNSLDKLRPNGQRGIVMMGSSRANGFSGNNYSADPLAGLVNQMFDSLSGQFYGSAKSGSGVGSFKSDEGFLLGIPLSFN